MMKAFRRLYRKEHVAEGVKAVAELQNKVMEQAPTSAGPMAALAPKPAPAGAEPQELLEGHCLGCGEKKPFMVEGEQQMKNGAVRKFGKCSGAGCDRKISTFVKGEANAST
jgi:hypothetical protein